MSKLILILLALGISACSFNKDSKETFNESSLIVDSGLSSYSFGESIENGSVVADKVFTADKGALASVTISGVSIEDDLSGAFAIASSNGCNRSLIKVADKCTIKVKFLKNKAEGEYEGVLRISAGANSKDISLSARVLAPLSDADLLKAQEGTLEISSLDFGIMEKGSTLSKILTLKNDASRSQSLSVSLSSPNFLIQSNGCPASLASKKSCSIKIQAKGPSTSLSQDTPITATLSLGVKDFTLSSTHKAEVVIPAVLKAYENGSELSSLNFSPQESGSITKIVQIKNEGGSSTVVTAQITGSDFTLINQCNNVSLIPNAFCLIKVSFKAAGKAAGPYQSTLSFGSQSLTMNASVVVPVNCSGNLSQGTLTFDKLDPLVNFSGATTVDATFVRNPANNTCIIASCDAGHELINSGYACQYIPQYQDEMVMARNVVFFKRNKQLHYLTPNAGNLSIGGTTTVTFGKDIATLAAAPGTSDKKVCVALSDKTTQCSGNGYVGDLSVGVMGGDVNAIIPWTNSINYLNNPIQADKISLSGSTGCFIDSGAAYCSGSGNFYRLGNNDNSTGHPKAVPVLFHNGATLVPLTNVDDISLGSHHGCAKTTDNKALCWGSNDFGSTGTGHTSPTPYTSVAVKRNSTTELTDVVKIESASGLSCAIAGLDRRAYCWGRGSLGQLGNLILSHQSYAVEVKFSDGSPVTDVKSLSLGQNIGCVAVGTNKKLYCWGLNKLASDIRSFILDEDAGDSVPFAKPMLGIYRGESTPREIINVKLISSEKSDVSYNRSFCVLLDNDRSMCTKGFNSPGAGDSRRRDYFYDIQFNTLN